MEVRNIASGDMAGDGPDGWVDLVLRGLETSGEGNVTDIHILVLGKIFVGMVSEKEARLGVTDGAESGGI